MADSFVEAVGALSSKGLRIFSSQFFSFDGDRFRGGWKLPLDISLGKGFKWKSPYLLGKLIEWKLISYFFPISIFTRPYLLGKLIEWKRS